MTRAPHDPSSAELVDRAVDQVLAGERPFADAALRSIVDAAVLLRANLAPIPAGAGFADRLGARLVATGGFRRGMETIAARARRELRRPSRAVLTGAASSAALGVGLTALALWRINRRHALPVSRMVHR